MKQSKLINIFLILDRKELLEARELLNTNLLLRGSYKKECADLFDYILKYYPNCEHEHLTKSYAASKLFPNSPINRLEKTMTALLHIIEFYIVHFLKKDKYDVVKVNHTLTQFFSERNHIIKREVALKKAKQALSQYNNALDTDYYYWKSVLEQEDIDLKDVQGQNLDKNSLLELFQAVNEHSILKILKRLSEVVLKRHYFEDYDLDIFYKLDNIIKEEPSYKKNILLQLYYIQLWMFKTILEDNFVIQYENYLSCFIQNQDNLDKNTIYSFSSRERTCLVYRYSKQPTEQNLKLLFNTYNRHLDNGTLLLNGRIYSSAAVNIINYALKLDEVEWIKDFLNQWNDKIGTHNDNKEEVLNLCWAMYYFAKKDYKKVEENVMGNFENMIYALSAKRFRIKVLFERKEYEKMYSELEAFKVYLFRNVKNNKIYFEWNNNFVNFLKQLYVLKFEKGADRKEKLIDKIQTQVCSDKEWLLEKMSEF